MASDERLLSQSLTGWRNGLRNQYIKKAEEIAVFEAENGCRCAAEQYRLLDQIRQDLERATHVMDYIPNV